MATPDPLACPADPAGQPWDLSALSVRELLQLEAAVNAELRARSLVRTNNKPLGDIAEHIVLAARGGVLEPNSTRSHDITDPAGRRIQVKAMGPRARGTNSTFSPFRSFGFDTAVFLVFEAGSFALRLAREVPAAEIETAARFVPHINGRQPTLRLVENLGVDVTEEMAAAFETLNNEARG